MNNLERIAEHHADNICTFLQFTIEGEAWKQMKIEILAAIKEAAEQTPNPTTMPTSEWRRKKPAEFQP